MTIKARCFLLGALTLSLFTVLIPAHFANAEIDKLFQEKKFSAVLEKTLALLNEPQINLTAADKAFLTYYAARSYEANRNPAMAEVYFQKVENDYPLSPYLKAAYQGMIRLSVNRLNVRDVYLTRLYEKFPNSDEAVQAGISLVHLQLQFGNMQKALLILDKIITEWKRGDAIPELFILQAQALCRISNYSAAVLALRQVEKKAPEILSSNPENLFYAGKILYFNLSYDQAVRYLQRLLNVYPAFPQNSEAVSLAAQALEREKKELLAAVVLISVIKKNPDVRSQSTLYLYLGRILSKLPPADLQQIAWQTPLYADPGKILRTVQKEAPSYQEKMESTVLLGAYLKNTSELQLVLDNYQQILRNQRDPIIAEFFKQNAADFIARCKQKGDDESVLRFWVEVKKVKSLLNAETLLNIAQVLSRMNFYANAEELYSYLLQYKVFSSYWDAVKQEQIRNFFQQGKWSQCLACIKALPSQGMVASDPELLYYQIVALNRVGQIADSERLLSALDIGEIKNEHYARLLFLQAELKKSQQEYLPAQEDFNHLLAYPLLNQELKGAVLLHMADIVYQDGQWDLALQNYQAAEAAGLDLDWISFQKYNILKEKGDNAGAAEELKRLQKLYPQSFWTRQLSKNAN